MESTWASLQPKSETGAADFIANSGIDGSGIVVAILDTGVDPGAAGLLVCPDGRPKVIDCIDCTGSGDVDTTTKASHTADESGGRTLQGLTGRTLKLNPAWNNPSGEWRLGVKRAFELFPGQLKGRVKEKRNKAWAAQMHSAQVALKQAEADAVGVNKNDTAAKDAAAALEILTGIGDGYDDPGPVYDCVVWHDGEHWCAAVDCDEGGDMTSLEAMRSFKVGRQCRRFSAVDNFNFSVTIFQEGDVLSICVDAGAHGTHVAGIVAAYHPDQPELNGVAPGAQIVNLKIGDSRLGSMETGTGLQRALIEAVKHKVDVINMSYGEAACLCDKGRFVELAEEVVHKHGIVFVSSAGNNGPALTTVGTPGGTSSALLSVAAMVSPAMMAAQYSALGGATDAASPMALPEGTTYTWSSVGPAADGDRGVAITAPGGAISPVPTWTLNGKQLMNGTSMSSPNAAGCVALILAGAQSTVGIKPTPAMLRRALENSSKPIEGVHLLSQGCGMVQVGPSVEWLKAHATDSPPCGFAVKVNGAARGVYLREAAETTAVSTHDVTVSPRWHEDTPPEVKTALDLHLNLASDAPWCRAPSHLHMASGGRGFSVAIDPSGLAPGLHCATVTGSLPPGTTTSSSPAGFLFQVPVTVVKPQVPNLPTVTEDVTCGLGSVHRYFYAPPQGATWVDVTIQDERDASDSDGSSRIMALHLVQLVPKTPYRDQEAKAFVRLLPGASKTLSLCLEPGLTLEVCAAQYWSTRGSGAKYTLKVDFRGVEVSPSSLCLAAGQGHVPLRLRALLKREEVAPSATLTHRRRPVMPLKTSISPLHSDRDMLPSGKQLLKLDLEWAYTTEAAGEEATFRLPMLQGVLYEAAFDSQLVLVEDDKGKLLGVSDAWPGAIKLGKGKHRIRCQVRHDSLAKLSALEAACVLWVETKLKEAVTLPLYVDPHEGSTSGATTAASTVLKQGATLACRLSQPKNNKVPDGCLQGDVLIGSLACVKKAFDSSRPKGWPITYLVGAPPPKKVSTPSEPQAQSTSSAVKDELAVESETSKLAAAVLELKIKTLATMKDNADFDPLCAALQTEAPPKHLPLLRALLARALLCKQSPDAIASACDGVLGAIDATALSAALNLKVVDEEAESDERKKLADQKAALLEALTQKAKAHHEKAAASGEEQDKAAAASALKALQQWEDVASPGKAKELAPLALELAKAKGHGAVLKYCNAALSELAAADDATVGEVLRKEKTTAMQGLGWGWIVEHEKVWQLIKSPKSAALY